MGTSNNDECFAYNKKKCTRKKNKCSWTQCTPPPTSPPVEPPTGASEGCYSNDYKNCLPKNYDDESSCNKVWLPDGAKRNCAALWSECESSSDCCGSAATCSGDGSYSVCVPESNSNNSDDDDDQQQRCIQCNDNETQGMKKKGQDCATIDLGNKCNRNNNWKKRKFCQQSCYDAGLGYDGDVCPTTTVVAKTFVVHNYYMIMQNNAMHSTTKIERKRKEINQAIKKRTN